MQSLSKKQTLLQINGKYLNQASHKQETIFLQLKSTSYLMTKPERNGGGDSHKHVKNWHLSVTQK